MKTKKTAQIGMFIALAFVLSYLETMIPINFGIPGIKPGLSNLVVLFCLYRLGTKTAFCMAVVRIVLAGLTFGNLSTMMYSLAGGILSFIVMYLLKKSGKFSVQGVSAAGGVTHNIGQLIVAAAMIGNRMLAYYMPFLLVSGVLAGAAVGLLGGILIKRVPDL